MQKSMPVILFVVFIMTIFLFSKFVYGENVDIVINEIGAYEPDNHEWIEIYNKGESSVDIEGWKFIVEGESKHGINLTSSTTSFVIEPEEYAIIAENDINFLVDYPDYSGKLFDSSWGGINEDGTKKIGLEDGGGVEIEYFNYPSAPDFSLERKDSNELATDESNWQEHPTSTTIGQKNYWSISSSAEATEDGDSTDLDDDSTDDDTEVIDDTEGGEEDTETTTTTDQTPDSDSQTPTTTIELKINEFVPNPSSGNEWIEIYNPTTSSVDLAGWKLFDAVGEIATPTSTIDGLGFFVVELSSSKLNNTGGDSVILKDSNDTIIDSISYVNVTKGNSIARSVDGAGSFAETTSPTYGLANQITAPIVQQPTSGGGGGGSYTSAPAVTFNFSDLVINEIVSDPSDNSVEFVELYNNTGSSIDLANWWIEDGSESRTNLTGSISTHGFKLVESPKGNLNNSGDLIILFSPTGKEIDRVTYGTWDDGNTSDNALSPNDPLSLIRKVDGQDSNNDYYDFVLTSTITPGSSNIVSAVTADGEIVEQLLNTAKIKINEVMPNPVGSDVDNEFIELKNEGTETINLQNWSLGDSSSQKYIITQGIISPGGYIIFKRSMTGIALNNTGGDEVRLYSIGGSLVDSIKYSSSAREDESYSRKDDNTWAWTIKPTLGLKNIIEGVSSAPIIAIDVDTEVAVGEPVMFDASDTTDLENDSMVFEWNFADGSVEDGLVVEHTFMNEGVYNVKLKVIDSSGNEAIKQVIITVKNVLDFVGGYFASNDISQMKINEFIPNPTGSDTTEFIELYNSGSEEIDLSGIKLDDEEGGSRAYTFPDGTIVSPGEYFVVGRQDSKLALNNTSDSVRLLYPDGTILQEVRYDDVPEGASYALNSSNDVWSWTGTITAGEENIISNVRNMNVRTTLSTSSGNIRIASKSKMIKSVISTTLEKLRDEDVGDKVKVIGVVAVEPGVLSSQYFYIVGSPLDARSGQAGVQVYMYSKDFPELKIGDRIEITGEISEAYGETRVKLASRDDIKVIDHPGDPVGKVFEIADLQEPYEGWLVQVNGEITELKSSYMYVDDGTEEIKIYFKRGAGINNKILQVGDLVNITGLLAQTAGGYQILPRSQNDIEKTGVAESFVAQIENQTEAGKKETAEKYLTATAGGLTSILIGLFAKARGARAVGFAKRMTGVAVAVVKKRKG
ncbi:lamin tail domain-containing protein [Patescibacteria group bacterium]|nr:lamin tail domain-containing protein [Patescibacteria group bacterium]